MKGRRLSEFVDRKIKGIDREVDGGETLTNISAVTGIPYLVFGRTYVSEYGGCEGRFGILDSFTLCQWL